jgi:hypothetical protein
MPRSPEVSSQRLHIRYVVAIAWLLTAGCSSACPKPLLGNSSGVVVLLDYSKSFAPYSVEDAAALAETNRAIVQMVRTGALAQPVKILWAAFGDNGLRPLLPCGPARVFSQSLTGRRSGQNPLPSVVSAEPLSKLEQLESWLSVCVNAVRSTSQTTEQFTDISGALMFGSDAIQDISDARVIVLFTDLLEDQPPNRKQHDLKMGDARLLLLWRPGLDDEKQPAAVSQRVEDWRKRLGSVGASRVCAKAAQGLTEGEISSCLWK